MQNPAHIVNLIVERLRAIPAVVQCCGSNANRIYAYRDAPPDHSSLSRAIYQMISPGVMVAWMGSGPITEESLGMFGHDISIFVCAEDNTAGGHEPTYANLITAILNGKATDDPNRWISMNLTPDLELMTIPTIRRINDDVGEHDRFEISTRINETTDF